MPGLNPEARGAPGLSPGVSSQPRPRVFFVHAFFRQLKLKKQGRRLRERKTKKGTSIQERSATARSLDVNVGEEEEEDVNVGFRSKLWSPVFF